MQVDITSLPNGQAHTDLDAMREVEELLALLERHAEGMKTQVGASAEDAERARHAAATANEARAMLADIRKLTEQNAAYASEVGSKSEAFRKSHRQLEERLNAKTAAFRQLVGGADERLVKARQAEETLQALLKRVEEEDFDLGELKELAFSAHTKATEVTFALRDQRKQAQSALAQLNRSYEAALQANSVLEARVSAYVRRATQAAVVGFAILLIGMFALAIITFTSASERAGLGTQITALSEDLDVISTRARNAEAVAENAVTAASQATATATSVSERVREAASRLSSARIAVLNGIGEDGLAAAAADALRDHNLAVVAVGNATGAERSNTSVYYRVGSESAAAELAFMVGAASISSGDGIGDAFPSSQPPLPAEVDLVLVVGREHSASSYWNNIGDQRTAEFRTAD